MQKKFIDKGVDVNHGSPGETPLECASFAGKYNMCKFLINHGAKVTKEAVDISTEHRKDKKLYDYLFDIYNKQ